MRFVRKEKSKIKFPALGRPRCFFCDLLGNCGGQAGYNIEFSIYNCAACGDQADVVVFRQEMCSSDIHMAMDVACPLPTFEKYD